MQDLLAMCAKHPSIMQLCSAHKERGLLCVYNIPNESWMQHIDPADPASCCLHEHTQITPTLHSDHHPGPALLNCCHASADAKNSNPTLMMQRWLLGEHNSPFLCPSMVQLAIINSEWIHNAWRSLAKPLQTSSPPPSLGLTAMNGFFCNGTDVICLWGAEVGDRERDTY